MIFCVEDDSNIRELVVYTLESTGFQARGFEDGSSFLEALALETPELVLLDIMLPGEDGMELLSKLKASKKTREIPDGVDLTYQGCIKTQCKWKHIQ